MARGLFITGFTVSEVLSHPGESEGIAAGGQDHHMNWNDAENRSEIRCAGGHAVEASDINHPSSLEILQLGWEKWGTLENIMSGWKIFIAFRSVVGYNHSGLLHSIPMKHPIRSLFGFTILAGVSLVNSALAVNIDWVQVDNSGYGAVGYEYAIGKYEVTNAQYAEFLNAKGKTTTDAALIWNSNTNGITQGGSAGSYTYAVTAGWELRPVNYVSWFDAARFTNWLGNGQVRCAK